MTSPLEDRIAAINYAPTVHASEIQTIPHWPQKDCNTQGPLRDKIFGLWWSPVNGCRFETLPFCQPEMTGHVFFQPCRAEPNSLSNLAYDLHQFQKLCNIWKEYTSTQTHQRLRPWCLDCISFKSRLGIPNRLSFHCADWFLKALDYDILW